MSKDPHIDPDELALFRREMVDVQRLKHDKVTHTHRRSPLIKNRKTKQSSEVVGGESFSDEFDACSHSVGIGDELSFTRPGIQKKLLRKLRRGQLPIGAELDLHGYVQKTARSVLSEFLQTSLRLDIRCVKIVHGKGYGSRQGKPVLKGKVNSWLRQCNEVLAFNSARPEDGGTGAVYVLLKKAVNKQ